MLAKIISIIISIIISLSGSLYNISLTTLNYKGAVKTVSIEDETNGRDAVTSYKYVDEDGNEVKNDDDIKKYSSMMSSDSDVALPAKYDSRDYSVITNVKNQGYTSCCWAFAAISAAETSLIKKGKTSLIGTDFSEAHLTWFSFNSLVPNTADLTYGDGLSVKSPYTLGGNWKNAVFNLARWSGVQSEVNAPFYSFGEQMGNYDESTRYTSYAHLQNSQYIPANDTASIKQKIIDNGSITCTLYYLSSYLGGINSTSYFENTASPTVNHAVTIVGWDDNYDASEFNGTYKPTANGAWLVKNSWGTSFGDDGYFWVSYMEPSLKTFVTYDMESSKNYDNNYQYDGYGYKGWAYAEGTTLASQANVFTAKGDEELNAVSFYTLQQNVSYTVKIYKDVNDGSDPESGNEISTASGFCEYQSYKTVKLPGEVHLDKGEKFSVVVKLKTDEEDVRVAIEYPAGNDGNYDRYFHSEQGQSYFNFYDENGWTDSSVEGYNNVCIKAFTDNDLAVKEGSTLYMENSKIYGVEGLTSEDTLSKEFSNEFIKSSSSAMGTGTVIYALKEDGSTISSAEIIRMGDFDGDGKVTSEDKKLLVRYFIGEISFDQNQLYAADLYPDGRISIADLMCFYKLL